LLLLWIVAANLLPVVPQIPSFLPRRLATLFPGGQPRCRPLPSKKQLAIGGLHRSESRDRAVAAEDAPAELAVTGVGGAAGQDFLPGAVCTGRTQVCLVFLEVRCILPLQASEVHRLRA
jgi:hypothetical protein